MCFGTQALRLAGSQGSQRVQMRVPAMELGMGLEWQMAWGMSYDSRRPEMKQNQETRCTGVGRFWDKGGQKKKAESRKSKLEKVEGGVDSLVSV